MKRAFLIVLPLMIFFLGSCACNQGFQKKKYLKIGKPHFQFGTSELVKESPKVAIENDDDPCDTLILMNGQVMEVKILNEYKDEIVFERCHNSDGFKFEWSKLNIDKIIYARKKQAEAQTSDTTDVASSDDVYTEDNFSVTYHKKDGDVKTTPTEIKDEPEEEAEQDLGRLPTDEEMKRWKPMPLKKALKNPNDTRAFYKHAKKKREIISKVFLGLALLSAIIGLIGGLALSWAFGAVLFFYGGIFLVIALVFYLVGQKYTQERAEWRIKKYQRLNR